MAKFLVALTESESFSKNLFRLTKDLYGDLNKHLFVGLIVQDLLNKSQKGELVENALESGAQIRKPRGLTREDRQATDVISICMQKAQQNGIKCEIYNDFHITTEEAIKQTTFADLLILSYQIFFNRTDKGPDSSLLYEILRSSKCPVMILPDNIRRIDNIIFTYDGKDSSAFAIRAFSNLFSGQSKNKPVSLLNVMPSPDKESIKNEKLLMELIKQSFNDVGIRLLEGRSISEEINEYLKSVSNPLIILGAYGRSRISNILLPNVSRNLLTQSGPPLFIANR